MSGFTKPENRLICELGVYGIWLLKFAKQHRRGNNRLRRFCAKYINGSHGEALSLMRAIDTHCWRYGVERPGGDYEAALNELIHIRAKGEP